MGAGAVIGEYLVETGFRNTAAGKHKNYMGDNVAADAISLSKNMPSIVSFLGTAPVPLHCSIILSLCAIRDLLANAELESNGQKSIFKNHRNWEDGLLKILAGRFLLFFV